MSKILDRARDANDAMGDELSQSYKDIETALKRLETLEKAIADHKAHVSGGGGFDFHYKLWETLQEPNVYEIGQIMDIRVKNPKTLRYHKAKAMIVQIGEEGINQATHWKLTFVVLSDNSKEVQYFPKA